MQLVHSVHFYTTFLIQCDLITKNSYYFKCMFQIRIKTIKGLLLEYIRLQCIHHYYLNQKKPATARNSVELKTPQFGSVL